MGFKSRLERERKKMLNPKTKLDIRRRHPVLRSVEGWYSMSSVITDIVTRDQSILDLRDQYTQSRTQQKFTRWLIRNKGLSENVVADIGKLTSDTGIKFRISCRHNDLLRLGETNHYDTCMNQWRGVQQLRFLADPDIAIVYVADAAGKFQWRSLLRLVLSPEGERMKYSLLSYRPYGNALEFAILWWINKTVMPVYVARTATSLSCRVYLRDRQVTLYSATEVNNKCLDRPVWSDHGANKDILKNRIRMEGSKFDLASYKEAYITRYLPAYSIWRHSHGNSQSSVSVSEGILHIR